uniref:LRAT domain-containing protein n=1 Tax=Acrobeloides nanus TaxID=290746 RepID=A0A914D2G5_9BILA
MFTSFSTSNGKVTEWTIGSKDEDLDRLQIGDLLEFNGGQLYNHWAVFVGNDSIVHLFNTNGDYFSRKGNGKIVLEKIIYYIQTSSGKHTANSSSKSKLKWRINNGLDGTYQPLPAEDIKKTAIEHIGDGQYSLITYNCEHFANDCRYGREYSRQVNQVAGIVGGSLGGSLMVGSLLMSGGKTEDEN